MSVDSRPRLESKGPSWVRLGVGFGLLGAVSMALFGPIGVSTTYPRVVGAALDRLFPGVAAGHPYLAQIGVGLRPETLLVVGLLIGGFLAARLSSRPPSPALETIHGHEKTPARRYWDAFWGGVLLLFGARLAGGCTSGHIISGISQLAVSGVLFGVGVFAAGIVTAKLLKGGR